jgi:hypothetical protein
MHVAIPQLDKLLSAWRPGRRANDLPIDDQWIAPFESATPVARADYVDPREGFRRPWARDSDSGVSTAGIAQRLKCWAQAPHANYRLVRAY